LRIAGHNVAGKYAKAKAFALIKNWRSAFAAEERQSGVDILTMRVTLCLSTIRNAYTIANPNSA
jgi:hypothetical protein